MLRPVFAATLLAAVFSCQNLRLIAQDGSVVIGRSLEFSELPVRADNFLVTEPAGTNYTMPELPNCSEPFVFTSRHKIARFRVWFDNEWANTTLGGMNDAGLSASTLYFTGYAHFKNPSIIRGESCQNAVPQTSVATYVLARYARVRELRKDLQRNAFPKVWNQGDLGQDTIPVHFVFHDTTGHSIVLEYTKKNGIRYFANTVGVMTNSPDYQWHITNLRNYPTVQREEWIGFRYSHLNRKYKKEPQWVGTGFSGIPGDYSSPSRFIKAATLVSHSGQTRNADQAVTRMFHMMNAADIPKGILSAGTFTDEEGHEKEHVDYTWWISVYDLSRQCIYFRGYDDLSVKRVCLEGILDEPAFINVEGDFYEGFTDKTGDLDLMSEM